MWSHIAHCLRDPHKTIIHDKGSMGSLQSGIMGSIQLLQDI